MLEAEGLYCPKCNRIIQFGSCRCRNWDPNQEPPVKELMSPPGIWRRIPIALLVEPLWLARSIWFWIRFLPRGISRRLKPKPIRLIKISAGSDFGRS